VHLLAEKTKSTKIFKNSLIGLLVIGISLPPRKYPKRLLIFIGLVKPVIIMVKIFFYGKGTSSYKEDSSFIQCVRESDDVVLSITEGDRNLFISLDKSTAIRLAKKLRTEINKIQEGGQNV
jgi:hypothetical protein